MKSTKLLITISELWNDKQLGSVRNSLLRGIEELNKKFGLTEIIEELNSKDFNTDIELETSAIQLLLNVDKSSLLQKVRDCATEETVLVLYVGPVTSPGGQWLLGDGIVSAMEMMESIGTGHRLAAVATLAPCEDWLAAEKRQSASTVSVCSYDLVECGDPIALGLSDFVDTVYRRLSVVPCGVSRSPSMTFVKSPKPSLSVFFDKGSSATPCLLLIDGFSMLLNVGYNRNPAMRQQWRHLPQLDAVLLTHVSYGNLLSLSDSAHDAAAHTRVGHLFLPSGVAGLDERSCGDSENPYTVELNNELAKVLAGCRLRSTGVSHLSLRATKGAASTATVVPGALKPLQLFHKIGYGSLEMVTLAPLLEDDANDGRKTQRGATSAAAVLLLWRPFGTGGGKGGVRRVVCVGPRVALRRVLPLVTAALGGAIECLRQPETDEPRRPPVAVAAVAKKPPSAASNGAPLVTKKPARPATTASTGKEAPTATVAKRPTSAAAKAADSRKPPATAAATTATKTKPATTRAPVALVTKATKAAATSDVKGDGAVAPKAAKPKATVANGDHKESPRHEAAEPTPELSAECGKTVAVGTVECAITEHGEADFCDDTPEEYSAEQMKEMGLYDDEEGEDRSSAPISDQHEFDDGHNLAHLPMEGSFYGKDNFDVREPQPSAAWREPLGMPVPVRGHPADSAASKKPPPRGPPPIYVDYLLVPAEIDRDDLRCLLACVRAEVLYVQRGECGLGAVLEVLLEVHGDTRPVTVTPSDCGDADNDWLALNAARLAGASVTVTAPLSRALIDGASCRGAKADL